MGLMGPKLDGKEVAVFLRACPGLAKTTIGELLGEPSDFWLTVLAEFVATFDFTGGPLQTHSFTHVHTHTVAPCCMRVLLCLQNTDSCGRESSNERFAAYSPE